MLFLYFWGRWTVDDNIVFQGKIEIPKMLSEILIRKRENAMGKRIRKRRNRQIMIHRGENGKINLN